MSVHNKHRKSPRDNRRHSDTTPDKGEEGSHEIQGVGTRTTRPEVKREQNTLKTTLYIRNKETRESFFVLSLK